MEAPDGTDARPIMPDSNTTSTSTVGLPLESRISRATIFSIFIVSIVLNNIFAKVRT